MTADPDRRGALAPRLRIPYPGTMHHQTLRVSLASLSLLTMAVVPATAAAQAVTIAVDGDLADLAAVAAPLAVSGADGPGAGPVADFGQDGTITELYAAAVDTTGDGADDTLWIWATT